MYSLNIRRTPIHWLLCDYFLQQPPVILTLFSPRIEITHSKLDLPACMDTAAIKKQIRLWQAASCCCCCSCHCAIALTLTLKFFRRIWLYNRERGVRMPVFMYVLPVPPSQLFFFLAVYRLHHISESFECVWAPVDSFRVPDQTFHDLGAGKFIHLWIVWGIRNVDPLILGL